MHFDLVDRVIEQSEDRIVTIKHVTSGEEYLQDHFATFPVLPGVMMLEAMVQAARRLAEGATGRGERLVLGRVRVLKYGRFVRPGATLRVEVTLAKPLSAGEWDFKGEATVSEPVGHGVPSAERAVAASGRFSLRPVRVQRAS
jgi:3-hydroxyacyl-[acyl-carrier-protein] dehydratase